MKKNERKYLLTLLLINKKKYEVYKLEKSVVAETYFCHTVLNYRSYRHRDSIQKNISDFIDMNGMNQNCCN